MKTLDENITTKASKLFKQYGIRGISMDDISREVGISKKTLYRYIEDKNDLVQSACDKEIKSVNDQFSSIMRLKLTGIDRHIKVYQKAYEILNKRSIIAMHDLRKYYPHIADTATDTFRRTICRYFEQSINEGIDENSFLKEIDAAFIAQLEFNQLENLVASDTVASYEKMYEMLLFHLRGMASSKGLKVVNALIEKTNIKNIKSDES